MQINRSSQANRVMTISTLFESDYMYATEENYCYSYAIVRQYAKQAK